MKDGRFPAADFIFFRLGGLLPFFSRLAMTRLASRARLPAFIPEPWKHGRRLEAGENPRFNLPGDYRCLEKNVIASRKNMGLYIYI